MDVITPIMLIIGGMIVGIAVTEYSMWRAQKKINRAMSRALEHVIEELQKNGKIREKIHSIIDDAIEYVIARIEHARGVGLESIIYNYNDDYKRDKNG